MIQSVRVELCWRWVRYLETNEKELKYHITEITTNLIEATDGCLCFVHCKSRVSKAGKPIDKSGIARNARKHKVQMGSDESNISYYDVSLDMKMGVSC